jgi:hypothetical protein
MIVAGQTYVSGGIFSNTTWNQSGSPYIVLSDVIVMTGVTLSIDSGVTVKFKDGQGLEIRGNLMANGCENDTIVFTADTTSPVSGVWSGISFWNDLELSYVKICYANTGLINTNHSLISISHSRFFQNTIGIDYIGSAMSNIGSVDSSLFDYNGVAISDISHADFISNCMFLNNNIGLGYVYSATISDCNFSGHTDKAIIGYSANYTGNIIQNNNIGMKIKVYNSSNEIKNNTITDNQTGVQVVGDATSTPNTGFYNNTICNNQLFNIELSGNVSVYLQNNCWCTSDSALIDNSIYDAHDNLSLGLVFFSPYMANCITSMHEPVVEPDISLYPNPASDSYTIQCNAPMKNALVRMYNAQGIIVHQVSGISGLAYSFNDIALSSGMYYVVISDDNHKYQTQKLFINQ